MLNVAWYMVGRWTVTTRSLHQTVTCDVDDVIKRTTVVIWRHQELEYTHDKFLLVTALFSTEDRMESSVFETSLLVITMLENSFGIQNKLKYIVEIVKTW